MSDWAVGDLAVCVDATPDVDDAEYRCAAARLEVGRTYHIRAVRSDHQILGLWLEEIQSAYNDSRAFRASRFRKVLPDKHEACETEFVTLLQRIKRKQVA